MAVPHQVIGDGATFIFVFETIFDNFEALIDVADDGHGQQAAGFLGLILLEPRSGTERQHDRDGGAEECHQQFLEPSLYCQVAPELGHLEFRIH